MDGPELQQEVDDLEVAPEEPEWHERVHHLDTLGILNMDEAELQQEADHADDADPCKENDVTPGGRSCSRRSTISMTPTLGRRTMSHRTRSR